MMNKPAYIIFDKVAFWSTYRHAHALHSEYLESHKDEMSDTVGRVAALAYIYWSGLTDGIRQERARRKQTAAVKLTVPPEIEHRIVELQKQERFRNMSTADLARHLVTLALTTAHQ